MADPEAPATAPMMGRACWANSDSTHGAVAGDEDNGPFQRPLPKRTVTHRTTCRGRTSPRLCAPARTAPRPRTRPSLAPPQRPSAAPVARTGLGQARPRGSYKPCSVQARPAFCRPPSPQPRPAGGRTGDLPAATAATALPSGAAGPARSTTPPAGPPDLTVAAEPAQASLSSAASQGHCHGRRPWSDACGAAVAIALGRLTNAALQPPGSTLASPSPLVAPS